HGGRTPLAGTGAILPAVWSPGLVARLARLRYVVKPPQQLPGPYIIPARIAAGPEARTLLRGRAHNHDIAIDRRGRTNSVRGSRELVRDPGLQIDHAVVTKAGHRSPRLRVERQQPPIASA